MRRAVLRICLLLGLGLAALLAPACRCERPRAAAPSGAPVLDLRDDAAPRSD